MDFSQLLAFLHWQNYVFLLIQPNIFQKKIDDNCKRNIFYRITIRIATNVRFSVRFYKEKCAKMQSREAENKHINILINQREFNDLQAVSAIFSQGLTS